MMISIDSSLVIVLVLLRGCGSQSLITADLNLSPGFAPSHSSRLPPGQLDLILSHPPGPLYLSTGCHNTELRLTCPTMTTLVIEAANFTPSQARQRLNCANRTKHSQPVQDVVIGALQGGEMDIRQPLNR